MSNTKYPFDRKSWLNSLKVGDEVCIDESVVGGDNRKSITTITKITPTRKFRVHINNKLFNEDGKHRQGWSHSILIPSTPEEKQGIRNRNRRHYVKNIDWSRVSQESIDKIYNILKEEQSQLRVTPSTSKGE